MAFQLIPRNPFPHSVREILKAYFQDAPDPAVFLGALLKIIGFERGVLTGSGRDALYFILEVLLEEGDELIVPAFSCNVILGSIRKSGILPVFADVSIDTLNMEAEHIAPLINEKTRAILVTHQFGYPAEIDHIIRLAKHKKILIIEDAAPAFGALYKDKRVGSFGDVAFFSFQDSKVISTIEGGLIIAKEQYWDRLAASDFSEYGVKSSFQMFFQAIKYCIIKNPILYRILLEGMYLVHKKSTWAESLDLEQERYHKAYERLSPLQINLGIQQLHKLDFILSVRKEAAELYLDRLSNADWIIKIPQLPSRNKTHVYARFPILVSDKDYVYRQAKKAGVDLGFTFSYTLPQYFSDKNVCYSNADFIKNHILNIPIYPDMKVNNRIINRLVRALC